MNLPKIKALDLRSDQCKVNAALDKMWQWPEFPRGALTFINTGQRPVWSAKAYTPKLYHVDVKISCDVTAFRRAMASKVNYIKQSHIDAEYAELRSRARAVLSCTGEHRQ